MRPNSAHLLVEFILELLAEFIPVMVECICSAF
jgi:hypothetical protein